jgi:hypothetical protein
MKQHDEPKPTLPTESIAEPAESGPPGKRGKNPNVLKEKTSDADAQLTEAARSVGPFSLCLAKCHCAEAPDDTPHRSTKPERRLLARSSHSTKREVRKVPKPEISPRLSC